MKKIYSTLIACILGLSFSFAQSVNYDVELVALERTNYFDCTACGAPDPTWKIGIYDNINFSPSNSCFSIPGNPTLNTPFSAVLRTQTNSGANSFTINFDGFEKNCNNDNCNFYNWSLGACFPSVYGDGNRCTNANLKTVNFRNASPCVWHTDTTAFCGEYRFIYRYKWNFNAPPVIATQPVQPAGTFCVGTATSLSVTAGLSSGWSTAANYQWQVSKETDCAVATTWTDVGGANSPTFTPPQTSGTRLYRVILTSNCSNNFASNFTISNCVRITYSPFGGSGDPPAPVQSGICGSTVLPGSSHVLNVLLPPSPGAALGVTSYDWSATGGSPTTGSGSSFTWTAPTTAGTYNINLNYTDNCPQADAATTCVVNVGSPNCDFAYVATFGTDLISAGGPDNPYKTLTYALTQLGGRKYIRVAEGTYNENLITLQSDLTIEGGYRPVFGVWNKRTDASTNFILSGFINSTTTGSNDIEGRVGMYANNVSNWTLQDLNVSTTDVLGTTPTNRGRSNYGILIRNNCSNYQIIRCAITSGAASVGADGTTPASTNGGNGGSAAGAGGSGANRCGDPNGGSSGKAGTAAAVGGPAYVFPAGADGSGGAGGNAADNCGGSSGCCGGCDGNDGVVGTAGKNGSSWQVNDRTPNATAATDFFTPLGQAEAGQNGGGGGQGAGGNGSRGGTCVCITNDGKDGGAGGSGGKGGTGGFGGFGSGGSFAIYRNNSSAGAVLTNVLLNVPATVALGGNGANGSIGLNGSNGGAGSCNGSACTVRCSGSGGTGGKGGNGGRGRDGANGVNGQLVTDGVISNPSTPINTLPVTTIEYENTRACNNSEIKITKGGGVWTFASDISLLNDQRDAPAGPASSSYTNSSSIAIITAANPNTEYDLTVSGTVFKNYLKVANINRVLPTINLSNHTICIDGSVKMDATSWQTETEYDWRIYQGTNVNSPIFQSTLDSATAFLVGVTPGIYTIRYRVKESCCGWSKAVYDTLRIVPLPMLFNVTGGGNYCPGGNGSVVSLSGSEPGVNYILNLNGAPVDSLTGTGGVLSFPPKTAVGNYTITAYRFGNCGQQMFGFVTIGINPSPAVFDVRGGGNVCASGGVSSREVYLTGSESGVNYQLYLNGSIPLSVPVPGSGAQISFGNQSTAGYYTVVGTFTATGCSQKMNDSAIITIVAAPNVYNITGGGAYCFGDSGKNIGLINSDTGVVYNLYLGSSVTYGPVNGTGGALDFGKYNTVGYYTVKATNANGCESTMNGVAAIKQLQNPAITGVSTTAVKCFGNSNGTITVSATTQNGSLKYSIDSAVTYNASNFFSGLPKGSYYIYVQDDSSCRSVYGANAVQITQQQLLKANVVNVKNILCKGAATGQVDITVNGGTSPYTFNWSNGNTYQNLFNVAAGTYQLTVTDQNSCTDTSSYTISEPANGLALSITKTDVKCFGENNGNATATLTGGTLPYNYFWSNGDTSATADSLVAGYFTIQVSDKNGCPAAGTTLIKEPTKLVLTDTVKSITCNGGNDGAINIGLTGGMPSYNFSWSNTASTQNLNALLAADYTVTASDANSCSLVKTYKVIEPAKITSSVAGNDPDCNGNSTGFAVINSSGGVQPYQYTWSTIPAQSGIMGIKLKGGVTYFVTITDANACQKVDSITLIEPAKVLVTVQPTDAKCFSGTDGRVIVNATGGSGVYNYYLNGIYQSDSIFTNLLAGNYVVVAEDQNKCAGSQTFKISQPAQFTLSAGNDVVVFKNQPTQLNATATSVNGILYYEWEASTSLSCTSCQNPIATCENTTEFVVKAMDGDSCINFDTVQVIVKKEFLHYIPAAFTPNGDGLNDRFEFDILGATTADVQIFDRWGEEVYSNPAQLNGIHQGGTNGWDGKFRGKDAQLDTYTYYIEVLLPGESTKRTLTGTIMPMH